MAPDGRSLVTAVGMTQSEVWIHDSKGDRQVSSEGFGFAPRFSPRGDKLYYLVSKGSAGAFEHGELSVTHLDSGNSERLFPGFLVSSYDISADDNRVAFSALDAKGKPQLWLASLDRRVAPKQISFAGEDSPVFGPDGDLFFRAPEGKTSFVYRMKEDGTGRQKAIPDPILHFHDVSRDGQWVVGWVAVAGVESTVAVTAYNTRGESPVRVCDRCMVRWSQDGKWFYVSFGRIGGPGAGGGTFVLPVAAGKSFPALPPSGLHSQRDAAAVRGAQKIDLWAAAPGPSPSIYAFTKTSVHRNLQRIPLP